MARVTGLEGVSAAETELSLVDGDNGHLVYRGYWARDLAIRHTFEEVAYLLWYGKLPTKEELESLEQALKARREIPNYVQQILDVLPEDMDMMSVVRTCVSSMGRGSYGWEPTIDQAIELTAIVPSIIAYRYRKLKGLTSIESNASLNHVANYQYMLTGDAPSTAQLRALEAYFVLTAEHGMNASTFSSRVISSTESDLASAITGAIGAMKGPLHGGAPTAVIDMLNAIGTKENAEPWIRASLEKGERIMGFGHRVYKTHDPRAEALKTVTANLSGEDHWLDLANHVEQIAIQLLDEYKPGRKLYTNVEFYAAAVLRAIDMSPVLFTPTFTASRVLGWTAHVLEQSRNNRIFRPQSDYIGAMPKE